MEPNDQRLTSTPPEAKIINAWAMASMLVLASVAEIVGMLVASWLLHAGKISTIEWGAALAYCLGGNVVAKARGKHIIPTTVAIAGFIPAIAKLVAASRMMHVIPLLFALSGCSTFLPLARTALQSLAPVALDALGRELAKSPAPVSLDTRGICAALPDDYQPDAGAVVACVGPDVPSASAAAGEALTAAADEEIDESAALCQEVPAGRFPGAVVVCLAPYVED